MRFVPCIHSVVRAQVRGQANSCVGVEARFLHVRARIRPSSSPVLAFLCVLLIDGAGEVLRPVNGKDARVFVTQGLILYVALCDFSHDAAPLRGEGGGSIP